MTFYNTATLLHAILKHFFVIYNKMSLKSNHIRFIWVLKSGTMKRSFFSYARLMALIWIEFTIDKSMTPLINLRSPFMLVIFIKKQAFDPN